MGFAWCLVMVALGGAVFPSDAAMTMQAFRQAKNMMKGVCQPRTGVSKEFLNQLSRGEFPESEDRNLRCYFECILRLGSVMKGNKISTDSLRRMARTMLPRELKPMVLPSLEACQDINERDPCDTAYAFAKCHHQNSGPEGFMFS